MFERGQEQEGWWVEQVHIRDISFLFCKSLIKGFFQQSGTVNKKRFPHKQEHILFYIFACAKHLNFCMLLFVVEVYSLVR